MRLLTSAYDALVSTPQPSKPEPSTFAKIATAVLLFGVPAACIHQHLSSHDSASSSPTTFSEQDIESSVVDTCQNAVRKGLKDPDSARFDDGWKAWEVLNSSKPGPEAMPYNHAGGDRWFEAAGSVNGKNSYGAYAGAQPYYCDAVVRGDNVSVTSHSGEDLLNQAGLTPGG